MNELIRIENGEVKMDSRMIAEHFGKTHANVLKDIRDEIQKLNTEELEGEVIFYPSSYPNQQNKMQPCFEMGEEGAMQLAARYDAVSRRKLIIKIKELKSKPQEQIPKSPMEFIALMAQQSLEQERKLNTITDNVQSIKDTIVLTLDNWRTDIKRMTNAIVEARGNNDHAGFRGETHMALERRASVNLCTRYANRQKDMEKQGYTKTQIAKLSKLDVIESDKKLKEIYMAIVKEYYIKYC